MIPRWILVAAFVALSCAGLTPNAAMAACAAASECATEMRGYSALVPVSVNATEERGYSALVPNSIAAEEARGYAVLCGTCIVSITEARGYAALAVPVSGGNLMLTGVGQ